MKYRMVAHPDQGQLHTVVDNDAAVMPPTHRPHPTERLFHYESNSHIKELTLGSHEYAFAHVSDITWSSGMFQSMHLPTCITTVPGYDLQASAAIDYLNLHPRAYQYSWVLVPL